MQQNAQRGLLCTKTLCKSRRNNGKKYHEEETHLPTKKSMPVHVSEVLRQVEGANLPEGGWVGGDAWFGSVTSAVELKKRLGVDSTFVVKNNTTFFPKEQLKAVLKARHPKHPQGHWVVFKTTIVGVNLIAIAYGWSKSGVSYVLSTIGNTVPSAVLYKSKFMDEFGAVSFNEINRPELVHFLFENLPLLDEHNKQRQSLLALERSWPTRSCWFRLLTTLLGMTVVDLFRIWSQDKRMKQNSYRRPIRSTRNEDDEDQMMEIEIKGFSDLLCAGLRLRERRSSPMNAGRDVDKALERITDKNGFMTREPTRVQKDRGRTVGASIQRNCLVCRKYLLPSGETNYQQTQFQCVTCKAPICKKDRSNSNIGRHLSCLKEHIRSEERAIGCFAEGDDDSSVGACQKVSGQAGTVGTTRVVPHSIKIRHPRMRLRSGRK